jgi:hypothetical protein
VSLDNTTYRYPNTAKGIYLPLIKANNTTLFPAWEFGYVLVLAFRDAKQFM